MNLNLDFNSVRTKHMFFKTKVRGYLLGSDSNEGAFQPYLDELGEWVNSLATKYNIKYDELVETNYLHNELADNTRKLVKLRTSGKNNEAREYFKTIETIGDQFLDTLKHLEQKIEKA